MTEYDYSPAAWEHYVAQQARVSNWVSQTSNQAHAYSNPFLLSPTLRDRSFYDEQDRRRQRPVPTRSKSRNLPPARQEEPYRHISSRPSHPRSRSHPQSVDVWSYPHSSRTTLHTASHSRNSSPHKPSSRSHTAQVIYPPTTAPTHQHHRAQPYPYPQKQSQPVRQHTSPVYHYPGQSHESHQRTVYLPPPRPGQSYHIPNGRLEYQYGVRLWFACVMILTLMLVVCSVLAS
ncbi:uncharacterized protein EDB91DRAFT_597781 [Suillus paluster]|uniref:uncharacterized protein n=1 Tax=Suillus paluster TaxID=48578 RepID=UPI001B875AF5|nr:uncharacterized protein EDB91DRAFT_597781 [Suillus paluster]KAG1751285.1 hypothetical protein EDB91DRAFT_597781 [Suillus paluster]